MDTKPIIFEGIFGASWTDLPAVLRKHYANRACTNDLVVVAGELDIKVSWLAKLFSPLMWLFGALIPIAGTKIPITVEYRSNPNNAHYELDRVIYFPGKEPYRFQSYLLQLSDNNVVEVMKSGICWSAAVEWDGQRVQMKHRGYKFKIMGGYIPLPITLLFGRGYAFEEAVDDETFKMYMDISSPIFGVIYSYSGVFKITEVRLDE